MEHTDMKLLDVGLIPERCSGSMKNQIVSG